MARGCEGEKWCPGGGLGRKKKWKYGEILRNDQ